MQEKHISEAEWEVMRVVWTTHPITSKDIGAVLEDKRQWKLATTKTLLGRLVKKGMLKTESRGRQFDYYPAISEESSVKEAADALLSQVCTKKVGSTIKMMMEDSVLSQSDLSELEQLIKEKKKTAPTEVACNCTPGQCSCRH
ncbi:Negative transcriptional regulator-copper transport operon [Alkalibacterium sp. AK22]|uniref:CopY/TcrY family copper transport repressor n=1 Tax=Alkalibacterium sp. AK22 TaxID=1229520 RepID=UPI000453A507|nr:CopY/TcrY family copper transport repressor [Alkalibacterium sp. AK22]EXJ23103.1 Negative transcriptional regulator-copper transport operon [Alkalibacterium sp. AK22]